MAGIGIIVVVTGVIVARLVLLRDSSRSVSPSEAVDRFRVIVSVEPSPTGAETPASSTAVAETLVEPGVYRYRTTGREEVDALDGAEHGYPETTTITIVPSACGVTLRWDALTERWDDWELCLTDAGIELGTSGTQYHEFFGQPEREAVTCDRAVVLVPAGPSAASPVVQSCTLADDPWRPTWEMLERTTIDVGGVPVDVQHVSMRVDDDDEYWEDTTVDWYLADNGLPVQVRATKSSSSPSPIGAVRYDEQYRLELLSLSPLR